jgi:hypothetical protein
MLPWQRFGGIRDEHAPSAPCQVMVIRHSVWEMGYSILGTNMHITYRQCYVVLGRDCTAGTACTAGNADLRGFSCFPRGQRRRLDYNVRNCEAQTWLGQEYSGHDVKHLHGAAIENK